MDASEAKRILRNQVIRKDKWWDLLSRFIEVLRLNLFLVDDQGRMILPPEEYKFGGRLLLDKSLRFDSLKKCKTLEKSFTATGRFLESRQRYDLNMYAIPIQVQGLTIAYVMVGPVRWHKTHEGQIESWAKQYEVDRESLVSQLNEVRVVSHVMINSILDLLSEMISNHVELSLRDIQSESAGTADRTFVEKTAEEIYSTVRLDELLVTLLDVALKMTETESGSVMVLDEDEKTLTIKVSKGITSEKAKTAKLRLGEGIAGIAASERQAFLIKGQDGDSRIRHLLKRPDIKNALVMPLTSKNRLYGVLNLHTRQESDKLSDNVDNLKYLTKLLSSAF